MRDRDPQRAPAHVAVEGHLKVTRDYNAKGAVGIDAYSLADARYRKV